MMRDTAESIVILLYHPRKSAQDADPVARRQPRRSHPRRSFDIGLIVALVTPVTSRRSSAPPTQVMSVAV
jgi:hypothetical protein